MSATLAFTGACSADLESFLPNKTADSIGRGQKKKVSEKCPEHKLCHWLLHAVKDTLYDCHPYCLGGERDLYCTV